METKTLTSPSSLNNKFIVEKYVKEALRGEVKNGFAFVGQKLTLKGLKTLVDAKLNDGTIVPKGSTVYIAEEKLHTQAWAQKPLEAACFQEPFLIVDLQYVEFVEPYIETAISPLNGDITYSYTQCQHTITTSGFCIKCGQPACGQGAAGGTGLPPGSIVR